jgi:hypothetical protein
MPISAIPWRQLESLICSSLRSQGIKLDDNPQTGDKLTQEREHLNITWLAQDLESRLGQTGANRKS